MKRDQVKVMIGAADRWMKQFVSARAPMRTPRHGCGVSVTAVGPISTQALRRITQTKKEKHQWRNWMAKSKAGPMGSG